FCSRLYAALEGDFAGPVRWRFTGEDEGVLEGDDLAVAVAEAGDTATTNSAGAFLAAVRDGTAASPPFAEALPRPRGGGAPYAPRGPVRARAAPARRRHRRRQGRAHVDEVATPPHDGLGVRHVPPTHPRGHAHGHRPMVLPLVLGRLELLPGRGRRHRGHLALQLHHPPGLAGAAGRPGGCLAARPRHRTPRARLRPGLRRRRDRGGRKPLKLLSSMLLSSMILTSVILTAVIPSRT